jgi:hypothetical protein
MALRRFLLVLLVIVLTGLAVAGTAHASAWVAPVPGCAIVTAYGQPYPGGTHRGVDLRAEPGTPVSTPGAGRVTFAGRVPADGGGTCGAVTVEFEDGLRVSLLPLSEVFVSAGETLAAGEVVGSVAVLGDNSHSESHLHLGLRRGEAYLDPTGLLPAAVVPAPEPDLTSDVGGVADDGVASGTADAPPAPSTAADPASGRVPGANPTTIAEPQAALIEPTRSDSPAATSAGALLPYGVSPYVPAGSVASAATHTNIAAPNGVSAARIDAPARHAVLEDAGIASDSALRFAAESGRSSSRGLPVVSSTAVSQAVWMAPVAFAVVAIRSALARRSERVCAK